jgi:putative endonuclease
VFYVYVLKSQKDKKTYVGFTRDVLKRLDRHNSGKVESTRHRRPFDLVYTEEFSSENEARKRERYLKTWAGRIWLHQNLEEVEKPKSFEKNSG